MHTTTLESEGIWLEQKTADGEDSGSELIKAQRPADDNRTVVGLYLWTTSGKEVR